MKLVGELSVVRLLEKSIRAFCDEMREAIRW